MTTTSLTTSRGAGRAGDKVFSAATLAAGCLILAVLFGVALFLVIQAVPALVAPPDKIQGGAGFFAYIWPIVIGTLIAAALGMTDFSRVAERGRDALNEATPGRAIASGLTQASNSDSVTKPDRNAASRTLTPRRSASR